eukprot:4973607-Lingulodinium_polyedra.AAC.1
MRREARQGEARRGNKKRGKARQGEANQGKARGKVNARQERQGRKIKVRQNARRKARPKVKAQGQRGEA